MASFDPPTQSVTYRYVALNLYEIRDDDPSAIKIIINSAAAVDHDHNYLHEAVIE